MVSSSGRGGKSRRQTYRRRAIVLVDVVNVQEHNRLIRTGRLWASVQCTDGCGSDSRLHGSFTRTWVDVDCTVHVIVIVRVRCNGCGGVWSLFPAFVWYRFRYCHRLVQASCQKVLAGERSVEVSERLRAQVSPILEERVPFRVPTESTIRSWMLWLGQRCLEPLVQATVSLIARRDAEAARALLPELEIRRGLSAASEGRERVRAVLRTAAVLEAVSIGRRQIFRRAPHQLRDWVRALFREQRLLLARPP